MPRMTSREKVRVERESGFCRGQRIKLSDIGLVRQTPYSRKTAEDAGTVISVISRNTVRVQWDRFTDPQTMPRHYVQPIEKDRRMNAIPVTVRSIDMKTGKDTGRRTAAFAILPAPEGTCPECGHDHEPPWPHKASNLHYQYTFFSRHNRWPTWADAMAHCDDIMKAMWADALAAHGIDIDGHQLTPEKSA